MIEHKPEFRSVKTFSDPACSYLRQIDHKIDCGFARQLGVTPSMYRRQFEPIIIEALENGAPDEHSALILVEPRIPFNDQANLLDISIVPGIFYQPIDLKTRKPYGIWASSSLDTSGQSLGERISNLSEEYKLVTPQEGLSCALDNFTDAISIATPGGKFKRVNLGIFNQVKSRTMAMESQFGKYVVNSYCLDEKDGLVDILVVRGRIYGRE